MVLDAASRTLSPLPDVLSHGLVAVSTFGLLSFFCSTSLFFYLTWRIISWRRKAGVKVPLNQFLVLIYNLLLADIQQSLAFLLNISSLRNNGIMVGTPTCFAQGWFVSTGDLASSVFICAIAVHTFFSVVKESRPSTKSLYTGIACCWFFVYALGAIGPIVHGKDFYVRAGAWVHPLSLNSISSLLTPSQCWINSAFQNERLWLHYFWIFVAMFSTALIYTFIVLFLRRHSVTDNHLSNSPSTTTSPLHGATPLMILYPLIYTICTAPLAAGRIYALAGHSVSLGYFCAAGTMIACNGWLDVLLYASTRADIVFSEYPPGQETGIETFAFMGKGGGRMGTVTTIEANSLGETRGRERERCQVSRMGRRSRGGDSVENLYGLGNIGVKGEVTVTVDVLPRIYSEQGQYPSSQQQQQQYSSPYHPEYQQHPQHQRHGMGMGSQDRAAMQNPASASGSWDGRSSVKSTD